MSRQGIRLAAPRGPAWALAGLLVACGGMPAPGPPPPAAATRDGRWVQDVDYLASQLPRLHPNLFFRTSRSDFERAAAELRQAVPSLPDHEVLVGLMRVSALPGDAHTTVGIPASFGRLPLRLLSLRGGLFVVAAAEEWRATLGARVVAVGEHDVADAEAAVASVIPHENEAWLSVRAPDLLTIPEVLHALRLTEEPSRARLLLEDENGARFTVDLPAAAAPGPLVDLTTAAGSALPVHRQRRSANYWFTSLDESRTLYLQYNRCQNAPGEPFGPFVEQVFRTLDAGSSDRLVVDIRHNAGGDSSVDDPLIRGLESRPAWRQRGRLFALIGGETFSSGMWTANDLRRLGAILVGGPTGGKPNSYGNVRNFSLPNSGLPVFYSTTFFRIVEDADPPSILPELSVEPTVADYRSGRDPLLEAAIRGRVE